MKHPIRMARSHDARPDLSGLPSRSVLLTVALLLITLAGCGNDDGPTSAAPDAPAGEQSTEDEDQTGEFPEAGETLTLVVGAAAGGGIDTAARATAPVLSEVLGVPVVVENVEGAGGRLAAQQTYRGTDDPYTIVTGVTPLHALGEVVFGADFEAMSFEPLYGFAQEPASVMVPADSPFESFDDLLTAAESGRVLHGNPGTGSSAHLLSTILGATSDLEFEEVPYTGTSEVVAAMHSGDVDFMVNVDSNLTIFDDIRSLGAMASERSPVAPDVPTLAEQGRADVPELLITRGWWASPGTPQYVIDALEAAFEEVYASDAWADFSEQQGLLAVPLSREELAEVDRNSYQLVEEFGDLMDVE